MTNFCSVAKLISMTLHDLQHFSLAWQRRGAKNHNTGRKKERDPLLSAPKSACLCPFLPPFPTIPVSSRYFFKARKQSIHQIIRLWKATFGKRSFPANSQSQPANQAATSSRSNTAPTGFPGLITVMAWEVAAAVESDFASGRALETLPMITTKKAFYLEPGT